MRKTSGVDTSELLERLRVLVGRKNLAVYNVLVRKAGYAVAYVGNIDTSAPYVVYRYYPTLRKAVIGELQSMSDCQ